MYLRYTALFKLTYAHHHKRCFVHQLHSTKPLQFGPSQKLAGIQKPTLRLYLNIRANSTLLKGIDCVVLFLRRPKPHNLNSSNYSPLPSQQFQQLHLCTIKFTFFCRAISKRGWVGSWYFFVMILTNPQRQ